MHVEKRIIIGALVGLFFAAGVGARGLVSAHERSSVAQTRQIAPLQGTQVAAADLEAAASIDFRPIETLWGVLKNVREHYVEQIAPKDEGEMTRDALRSMLGSLNDSNTRFVEPEQRRVIADASQGKFHGIGAVLGIKPVKSGELTEEHLIVVAPLPGGPAEEAGLRCGDDIIAINGKSVLPFDPYQRANQMVKDEKAGNTDRAQLRKMLGDEEKRLENGVGIIEAENQLSAEDGKSVELTVARNGSGDETKIKVKSREFSLDPIESSTLQKRYGYIRINYMYSDAAAEFGKALRQMHKDELDGLVLDLRNVGGGELNTALDVAKWLIPGKPMGSLLQSRSRKTQITAPSVSAGQAWSLPVVVLVNKGTAQTPELLAAALRDSGAARLVGERTYGNMVHSTLMDLSDGSAVLMTTGKFISSGGKDYDEQGVPVDVEIASTAGGDGQLAKALELLSSGKDGS